MTGFPLPTVIILCGVWNNGHSWRRWLDSIAGTTVNSPFKIVLLTLCFSCDSPRFRDDRKSKHGIYRYRSMAVPIYYYREYYLDL